MFSLDEMVSAFEISKVNSNPARFDQKKADAINAEHIRLLEPAEFATRLKAYLVEHGRIGDDVDEALFRTAADLVQTRIVVLGDAWDLLKFLFVDDADFTLDEASAAKNLKEDAAPVLDASVAVLEGLDEWTTPSIEEALKSALIEGLELKPRKAFAPVRVAVTGSHISPPLYESMELLGRERTLARLRAGRARIA